MSGPRRGRQVQQRSMHLGPLLLRDALLVLAGPAWALSVDDRTREVCFNRSADAAEVQS